MAKARTPPTLTEAVYRKDWARLEELLAEGDDPNHPALTHLRSQSSRALPLVAAIEQGNADMVERLLKAGAHPQGAPGYYRPMDAAIARGDLSIVKRLVECGVSLHDQFSDGLCTSYLEVACRVGTPETVQWMIGQGCNVNLTRKHSWTLLHSVMQNGITSTTKAKVRLLLDGGANPLAEAKDDKSKTVRAISYAVLKGDREIVEWFLDAGEDPNTVRDYYISNEEGDGCSLVVNAILHRHGNGLEILKALVQHGACLDERVNFNAHTVGCLAAKSESVQSNDGERFRGASLLALAAAWSGAPFVDFLLNQGLDPNARDKRNGTPLHAFTERGVRQGENPDTVERLRLLLKAGADPNLQDANGNTALHVWAGRSSLIRSIKDERKVFLDQILQLLLTHGADPEIKNGNQETSLDLAWIDQHTFNPGYELLKTWVDAASMEQTTAQATAKRLPNRM